MNGLQLKSILRFCAAGTLLFAASSAFAIGPSYQYVNDPVAAAITQLNDVVSLGISATPSVTATAANSNMQGTGSIIGYQTVPLNPNSSDLVLNVITALHVAQTSVGGTSLNQMNFGAGFNSYTAAGNQQKYFFSASLSPNYATYTLNTSNNNNGPGGTAQPEDMAIMQANYYYNPNNAQQMGYVTTITSSLVKLSTDFYSASNGGYQPEYITQVGYGQGGVWNGATGAYVGNNIYDAKRFQNNSSTGFTAPAQSASKKYFYPSVQDSGLAPTPNPTAGTPNNTGGTGIGFDADSGSPWLTGGATANVTVTPENPNDYLNGNAPTYSNGNVVAANTNLAINYSNNLSAVFVSGSPTAPVPTTQNAIPLLTLADTEAMLNDPDNELGNGGSYEWASSYAGANPTSSIPEPGTLSLIALGGVALLRRRSRQ